jgi:hypothetical protein
LVVRKVAWKVAQRVERSAEWMAARKAVQLAAPKVEMRAE